MKIILFAALLLGFCVFGKAQDTHFGLKAGLNISSLDVQRGADYSAKAGFHVGALAHMHLSPHFAAQPELVFSTQGGKDGDVKWDINYINVPVLFQYMAGNGFRVQTGPQLGFAVSSKVENGNVEVHNNDDVKTFDFSWSFGASYIGAAGLGVDARFNLGVANIYEPEVPEVRNRVFQVGIFYQFMNATMHARRR
jgi:hypothetical protein